MNTLDLYDFGASKPATPAPPDVKPDTTASTSHSEPSQPQPTLNEEVNQALGQLGRFWGGFRKQSQSAFELARKDFGQVVVQARSELGKIATEVGAASGTVTTTSESQTAPTNEEELSSSPVDVKGKGKERAIDEPIPEPPLSPITSGTFFSRLQAQLPPHLHPSALSSTLSSAPSSLQKSIDLAHIQNTLTTNIQRVQTNLNNLQAEKLAEEYLKRSETLFKEAGDYLKDAVKVIPPEEGGNDYTSMDGSDVWMFPSPIGSSGWGGVAKSNVEVSSTVPTGEKTPRQSLSSRPSDALLQTHLSRATRSQALLRRLKYDADMIRLDPSVDDEVKESYTTFVKEEVGAKGGFSSDALVGRISDVLKPGKDGELDADAKALIDTRDTLVPAEMTNDEFWSRYFFRVEQISRDEEKRKALIAGTDSSATEDEFSWEDDDDDEVPEPAAHIPSPIRTSLQQDPTTTTATIEEEGTPSSPTTTIKPPPLQPQLQSSPSATTSPRLSEDSYDLVNSRTTSKEDVKSGGGGDANVAAPVSTKATSSDGEDSDWE